MSPARRDHLSRSIEGVTAPGDLIAIAVALHETGELTAELQAVIWQRREVLDEVAATENGGSWL